MQQDKMSPLTECHVYRWWHTIITSVFALKESLASPIIMTIAIWINCNRSRIWKYFGHKQKWFISYSACSAKQLHVVVLASSPSSSQLFSVERSLEKRLAIVVWHLSLWKYVFHTSSASRRVESLLQEEMLQWFWHSHCTLLSPPLTTMVVNLDQSGHSISSD